MGWDDMITSYHFLADTDNEDNLDGYTNAIDEVFAEKEAE
jgi:hypothetical protein